MTSIGIPRDKYKEFYVGNKQRCLPVNFILILLQDWQLERIMSVIFMYHWKSHQLVSLLGTPSS